VVAKIENTPGTSLDPDVEKIAREVEAVVLRWGYVLVLMYGSTTWPDHDNRRCIDWMTWSARKNGKQISATESYELGGRITDYLWSHRDRLGLNWTIWRRKIDRYQNTDRALGRGNTYTGDNPHTDHVHGEFDGTPYTPPADLVRPDVAGPELEGAQFMATISETVLKIFTTDGAIPQEKGDITGNPGNASVAFATFCRYLWGRVNAIKAKTDRIDDIEKKLDQLLARK
jgi:hypothetical protein